MDMFQEELDAAVARYEEDTKHKLAPNTLEAFRNISSPEDLASLIEDAGAAFKDFRSKNGRVWSSLRKFVTPVIHVAWLASTPVSVLPYGAATSALLAAVVYLFRACEGVSFAYDWIDQVFCELQEFSARLDVYIKSDIDPLLCRKIAAILIFIIQVIGRCEKLIQQRRFKQYLKVVFLGKDAQTNKLVNDLNKLFGSENRLVLAVTYATAQRTEENTKELTDVAHQTEKKVNKVLGAVRDAQDQVAKSESSNMLNQVLCNTPAFENIEETFFKNQRSLIKGTGDWLLLEPLFNSWMTQNAAVLWIFGGPGTGKSYLTTWIVKELLENPTRKAPVAYFFVKENSEHLRDANIILKTLAWQIADQDSDFKRHAIEVCQERRLTVTAVDTWENLFLSFYGPDAPEDRKVTMIIDGLDEATPESRHSILGFIKNMVTRRNSERLAIQFAIIGRGSLRSDMDFKRLDKVYFVEVSKHKNQKNIDSYIRKRLEEFQLLREMRKMKPDGLKKANKLGSIIARKVSDSSDGVFLWAKLFLDNLVKKDRSQIEAALANPPSTMDDMIKSVFERLARDDGPDHEVLKKMLQFMANSRRPLLFAELDIVTSLPSRKPNYLLWKQTRGLLSSVFDLKFPDGVDPDSEDEQESQEKKLDAPSGNDAEAGLNESEEQDFDFSEFEDDTSTLGASGDDDYDDDIFSSSSSRHPSMSQAVNSGGYSSEDDLYIHLSYGQLHTEVTFCHARIRDYIAREGNPKKRHNPILPIIPLLTNAQADITIACLEIFRLECSLKDDQRYLCNYPICHMVYHLEGINRAEISQDQLISIIEGLYWLFGTERGTFCLLKAVGQYDDFRGAHDAFWQAWVKKDRYLKLLQNWFKAAEHIREHTQWEEPMCSWMQTAANSIEELLRPIMMTASNRWLSKPGFDSLEYKYKGEFEALLLHGWIVLIETGSVPREVEEFAWNWLFFGQLTPQRIEYIASWAGLLHDVHWHTCIGWVLMEGEHFDSAILHFNQAVELDSKAWVAFQGLGLTSGNQQKWEEAIEYMEKAIDALPPNIVQRTGYLYPRISQWAYEIDDIEKGQSAAEKGFEADPTSPYAQLWMLKALYEKKDYPALVSNLQYLDSEACESERHSLLVHFFVKGFDAFEEIGFACRKEGKPQFVIDAMNKSLKFAFEGGQDWIKIWLSYAIGFVKHIHFDLREEAVNHWKTFLDILSKQTENFQKKYDLERTDILNKFAQLYFDEAVDGWKDKTEDSKIKATELKKLAVAVSTSLVDGYEGFDVFWNGYTAMLWGRWLRDYQHAEESLWRKCFRSRLLDEMKRLDDDDPTNDSAALENLAKSLFHAGDRKNAGAILAILFKSVEHPNDETQPEQVDEGSKKEIEKILLKVNGEPASYGPDGLLILQRGGEEPPQETEGEGIQLETTSLPHGQARVSETPNHITRQDNETTTGDKELDESFPNPDTPNKVVSTSSGEDRPLLLEPVLGEELSGLKLQVGDAHWVCDNCDGTAHQVPELYFCEICPDVNWCGDCLLLLKDPNQRANLNLDICNPVHDFYRAWPIPEEARYVAAQSFENGVTVRKAWLDELRREWWE